MNEVTFLDYTIMNSSDGVVLTKDGMNAMPGAMNFGKEFSNQNIESAKKAATFLFMIARPEKFNASLYYRLRGLKGSYMEFLTLVDVCKKEGIELPIELEKPIEGGNYLIGFNEKPL